MLRKSIAALGVAAALFMASADARAGDWSSFTAADGTFSAEFPIAPKTAKTDDGFEISADPSSHESYILTYADLQASMEDAPDAYFDLAKSSLSSDGTPVISDSRQTLFGHPAADFEFRTKEGFHGWDRVITVGNRLYQLIYVTDLEEKIEPVRYWGSFSLH
ncbi:MAG: hypothetical protein GC166_04985 [Alphaproteobacteria bacterium]|nr:hypothetical protein [Alphaproteobacteria bacterium]